MAEDLAEVLGENLVRTELSLAEFLGSRQNPSDLNFSTCKFLDLFILKALQVPPETRQHRPLGSFSETGTRAPTYSTLILLPFYRTVVFCGGGGINEKLVQFPATLRQGETISLRLPASGEVDATCDEDNIALGSLLFADGSQKALAGFSVWLALLMTWKRHEAFIQDPHVVQLISSLLVVKTTFKATESITSPLDNTISKIVKQNADSRVQPVSSLAWASILSAMRDHSGQSVKFDAALEAYNSHPEVRAHSDKSVDGGAGAISLDNRRKAAVKNWLERTTPSAFKVVESSTHDLPFALGPYGETMASLGFMFVGSTVSLCTAVPSADLQPLENEPLIHVDWGLPMSPLAQTVLFKKVKAVFDRETTLVPAQSKKRYRLSQENLQSMRNVVCLWAQFQPHLETRVAPPEAAKWEHEMAFTSLRDQDFKFVLEARPPTLALSMFPSSRAVAQQKAVEKEQQICLSVEKQRLDVVSAQWSFFKAALERDQLQLEKVKEVPRKVAVRLHQKKVATIAEQAKAGQARSYTCFFGVWAKRWN